MEIQIKSRRAIDHPEAKAFQKLMIRSPNDMTVRLVYADWLDEHGYHVTANLVRQYVKLMSGETNGKV